MTIRADNNVTFTIPSLERVYWRKSGCKNFVKQLLAPKEAGVFNVVEMSRSYLVIEKNNQKYCLTCNKDSIPEQFDYVLLTNRRATFEKIQNNQVAIRRWLKHPKMNDASVEAIRSSWKQAFNFIEEDWPNQKGLRQPQIAALYSILGHLKVSDEVGTVVMPTGTGKTETMMATMIANQCNRLLVIVPSDALRTQISERFFSLGLLKEFGLVDANSHYPRVGVVYQNFTSETDLREFLDNCNIIVATAGVLDNSTGKSLNIVSDACSHVFFDEAHHIEANSWRQLRSCFPNQKILQFTATPFRNDRKRLEGKIIFNFSLRQAQEQGYFKPIKFLPIREYDLEKGDRVIAAKAVKKLKEDISAGKNHLLMARCENKTRAEAIFELYKGYDELNPVLIHSGISGKSQIVRDITEGKHKIIVAVNMLSEGFDLPQLKIAAFHDIRKSLPVTLQFAGRFTRSSKDEELGEATFIANLADASVQDELSELYSQDSNWNVLLSNLSSDNVDEQIDFEEFLSGFQNLKDSQIPFQNIRFAYSTVVYKNSIPATFRGDTETMAPQLRSFKKGIPNWDRLEYKFEDYNHVTNTLVAVTAEKSEIEWVNYKELYGLQWKLYVIFYDTATNLLFIHSSDKSSLYKEMANAVLNDRAIIINQLDIFKAFHEINRVSLQNVGLKEFFNKKITFSMRVGTDIEEALSVAEQRRGQKAFVFGSGYVEGNKITLGCSYKGRIWSYLRGDLRGFLKWCKLNGPKLIDPNVDSNSILRETLLPEAVDKVPKVFPTHITWSEDVYDINENKIAITINGRMINFAHVSLELDDPSLRDEILFSVRTPAGDILFKQELYLNADAEGSRPDFKITKITDANASIRLGSKELDLADFFNDNPPTIWFADGSSLNGNFYIKLRHTIACFPVARLLSWDWSGVNLSNEGQKVAPLVTDSIQYCVIQRLMAGDFDIIYDDDGSGEIADIVAIKESDDAIKVHLYHLKYAKDGRISNQIDNFYEVCGQAQKSILWKHKSGLEFFTHLLRREMKSEQGQSRSRLEKGTKANLERLMSIAKNMKPMEFDIYIVQPGLSQENVSDGILTLLGVTENYLKEVGNVNLNVIVNQ